MTEEARKFFTKSLMTFTAEHWAMVGFVMFATGHLYCAGVAILFAITEGTKAAYYE